MKKSRWGQLGYALGKLGYLANNGIRRTGVLGELALGERS